MDSDPVGATLVWRPGLNATDCTSVITTEDESAARQLAHDLREAKDVPSGPFNCGADQGDAVDIYLHYAGEDQAEMLTVGLSGCGFITAPNRKARMTTDTIRQDLKAVAPPAWQH